MTKVSFFVMNKTVTYRSHTYILCNIFIQRDVDAIDELYKKK